MDVMYFLFKGLDKLARWLTWLTFSGVAFLFKLLKEAYINKAQRVPAEQEETPIKQQHSITILQEVKTPQQQNMPAVHVHVHLEQGQFQPNTAPALEPVHQTNHVSPTSILNHPDHRIYITTGSDLMMEHPDSERLLSKLDEMLYYGAHRNGEPFTFNPPLDDSRAGGPADFQLPPVAAFDDGDFFSDEAHQLPAPDGALWLRKAGHEPQRLAANSPS